MFCYILIEDFSIAENVLSKYNSECAKAIQLSENRIYLALKSRLGTNTIVKLFKYIVFFK